MGWRMIVGPSVGGEGALVVRILAQKGATGRHEATNLWAVKHYRESGNAQALACLESRCGLGLRASLPY